MTLSTIAEVLRIEAAQALTDMLQPETCPCKLDAQNRQPDWYDDKRRPGYHNHHNAGKQYRESNESNRYAAGNLVGQAGSPFH